MRKNVKILLWTVCTLLLTTGIFLWIYYSPSQLRIDREVVELPLSEISGNQEMTIPATKIPEFTFDISNQKYSDILSTTGNKLKDLIEVKLIQEAHAENTFIKADFRVDNDTKKLLVKPQDAPNFKPGKYRLSLTLRTLEGPVNLEQDFTWGVIAVNTNKSIYKPGDVAVIGMGVLNDDGETMCMTGNKSAKVWLTITDPNGESKEFSTENKSIRDSGECAATSVTNMADFNAIYLIEPVGIYKMNVVAEVNGKKRQIEDYFKVEQSPVFEVERTSFPTRIYPRSPYTVTFSVTPREDYKGTIEDVVPNEFTLSSISAGGNEERSGEFKRIIWQVDLKQGVKKNFSYQINFPLVSPEFYLLGPIIIGEFKEARQWQVASDAINSTSGLAAWEDNGGSSTYSRVWTGTTWNPALGTTATTMSTTPADSRWFVEKSSPKTGEKIIALVDNTGGNDVLDVFTWNGSSWGGGTPSWNVTLSSANADVTRAFDVAYEEISGDALVVYSNYSTNQLLYRKRVGGAWDGAASNAGSAFDVYKRWVRLEPQFESDSILVGYLNNNERVGAMLWDGSTNSFGNQFSDAAGTLSATSDEQAFDIAWETNSGTPMIFWGTTGNNLVYREFSSGTWQAEATAASGFTNDLDWVFAAADPRSSSNNISLGLQDGTACVVRFGVWTGAAATMNGTTATCPSVATNNLVDTAFENNSGKAMWTYVTSGSPNQISWLTWTSGGGFTSGTTETGTTTTIEGMQLYSDLNTTSMILLYHDNSGTSSNCQLWHREWDGSSWSAKNANPLHANMCASADNDTEPYGFGFDRNLETQVGYRWFANNNGTSVSSALTSQDTPYTLTTANQAFRLRFLMYTPDTLTTSLRNYKLQYVDPGSGSCASPTGGTPASWTDVSTSGSDPISFNNNATPADGDNLTANGSLDPTYQGKTVVNQDYEEANPFTNTVAAINGDQLGMWDFSLIDNTTYDRNAQTFCFRIARSNDVVLQIDIYPQISTAAVADVLIQGGSLIQGGTLLQ